MTHTVQVNIKLKTNIQTGTTRTKICVNSGDQEGKSVPNFLKIAVLLSVFLSFQVKIV